MFEFRLPLDTIGALRFANIQTIIEPHVFDGRDAPMECTLLGRVSLTLVKSPLDRTAVELYTERRARLQTTVEKAIGEIHVNLPREESLT